MNEPLPAEETAVESQPTALIPEEPFYKKYKIHLSVAAAILVAGIGALSHYKNERVKAELEKAIGEYQQNLLLVGGEMRYDSLECSGVIWTDCEIEGIRLSMLGQEQLSIKKLRLGDVEEFEALKAFSEGGSVDASVDIEIEEIALPKPMLAQMVAENVSNAFQQSTLEKLSTMNISIEGEIEGNSALIKEIEIERFAIDNAIMPIEFSMEARDIVSGKPDSMILENFSLSVENRAVSDVTYESVKSFMTLLSPAEQAAFLKEFGLKVSDMGDKTKASEAINRTIAKRFEADLAVASGMVEKELIRAMVAMLRGEADEIVLRGENKNAHTMGQVQNFLLQSATMGEKEAKAFMEDKFVIDVEAD